MRSGVMLACALAGQAFAVAAEAQVPRATFSVVPRWQRIRLDTDVNPVSAIDMSSYGVSADVHSDGPFAFALNLNYAEGEETGAFRLNDAIERSARFTDVSTRLEYAPLDSALVFMLGARYLESEHDNTVLGFTDGGFSSETRMILAEMGVRLVGQPSPYSDHVVFAQGTIGLGVGESTTLAGANSSYGRALDVTREGFAANAEVAFGWTYYFAENASIGARLSGQVFGVELFDDGEPVFAWGPEFSSSWSF